jgi:predicted PhzF superfamily epimerase YddE/YHI9
LAAALQRRDRSGRRTCAVDNGAPWLVVRLTSADACVGLAPDPAALAALTHRYGTHGLAAYAPHPDGGPQRSKFAA